MIEKIMIMKDSGLPIFSWDNEASNVSSDLIAGFLTAMNMFAEGERGQQIKKITLDVTTFIFEKHEDNIFVILTQDEEIEQVIYLILNDVKEEFLKEFGEILKNFNGNVEPYKLFQINITQILNSYAYFDYLQSIPNFKENEFLKCVIIIEKIKGNLLYVKAKEYIDRDLLGFQSMVLIKSIERITNRLSAELNDIVVISKNLRFHLIKNKKNVVLIQEIVNLDFYLLPEIKIKEKNVNKIMKTPGKLLFEEPNLFVLCDQSANNVITNDKEKNLNQQIPTDLITSINACSGFLGEIYKEQLFSCIIFTHKEVYSVFLILNIYVFLILSEYKEKLSFTESLNCFEKLHSMEQIPEKNKEQCIDIISKIIGFQKKFL